MDIKKIKFDRKNVLIMAGIGFVLIVCALTFLVYRPLAAKIRSTNVALRAIEEDLKLQRDIIKAQNRLGRNRHLLTSDEISLAIDEITKAGLALNINFISISPQKVEVSEDVPFGRLPIQMDLESEYRNIGQFFAALENLQENIVTVKSFTLSRDAAIFPLVKSRLIVEMYLEGGSGEE